MEFWFFFPFHHGNANSESCSWFSWKEFHEGNCQLSRQAWNLCESQLKFNSVCHHSAARKPCFTQEELPKTKREDCARPVPHLTIFISSTSSGQSRERQVTHNKQECVKCVVQLAGRKSLSQVSLTIMCNRAGSVISSRLDLGQMITPGSTGVTYTLYFV